MYLFIGFTSFLTLFGVWCASKQGKAISNSKYLFLFVSFLGLLIISGLRGLDVGTDTPMYVRVFNNTDGIFDFGKYEGRFEVGYRLFQSIIAQFFSNPHFLLFISALITLGLVYRLFYKCSITPWYSVLMFINLMFYYNSMSMLRQYLAIAITCTAYTFLLEKRRIWFVLLCSLAALFHASSLAFLILLPFSMIPLKKKNRYLFVGITIVVSILTPYVVNLVLRIFPQYANYIESTKYYQQNKIGTILQSILFFIFFIIYDVVYKKWGKEEDITKLEYGVSLFGFAVMLASIQGGILTRIATYFTILCCVTVPNSLARIPNKRTRLYLGAAILIVCIAYNVVILVLRPYWSGVIPYVFIE